MITDVRTESPFWLMKNGFVEPYFALREDKRADFVVVGGGISGALTARNLARAGASVILIDRRHVAMGSTSASTALLQYDIDRTLHELIDLLGEKAAVRAYELSLKALIDLLDIAKTLKIKGTGEHRPGFRFAKFKKDVAFLEKEYQARSSRGFDMELWDERKVSENFPFHSPAALITRPTAIGDPYLLTHGILQQAIAAGAQVFDKTSAKRIEQLKRGVVVHTETNKISAKKVVIACGYESVNYLPSTNCTLNSSYAFASEPLPDKDIWYENCTFWDTGDPYIYGRTTEDNRVIFGGMDDPFYDPKKRDGLLTEKTAKLEAAFKKLFPDIPLKVDYSWAGTFIETNDGLPYIGGIKQRPHTLFALGYGGNGITFSQLAADILTDLLLGKKNADAEIFSFDRTTD